jgi:hypothetical protein
VRRLQGDSLQEPRGSEGDHPETLGDTIGADDHGFATAEDEVTIDRLMHVLTARERAVLPF